MFTNTNKYSDFVSFAHFIFIGTVNIFVCMNQTSKPIEKSCSHIRNTEQAADSNSYSNRKKKQKKTPNLHKTKKLEEYGCWASLYTRIAQLTDAIYSF